MENFWIASILFVVLASSGCMQSSEDIVLEGEFRTVEMNVDHSENLYNFTYSERVVIDGYNLTPESEIENMGNHSENFSIEDQAYLVSNVESICGQSRDITGDTQAYLERWGSVSREIVNPPENTTGFEEEADKMDGLLRDYSVDVFEARLYDMDTGRKVVVCREGSEGELVSEIVA